MQLQQPSHPPIRDEIQKYYSSLLKDQFGFDYWDAQHKYKEIGNEPGIYPDVCLLLFELISQYKPKKIVEIGSGFSTLVLSYSAEMFNSQLTSYDQNFKWAEKTAILLDIHKRTNGQLLPFNEKQDENIVNDADFVFYNGGGRTDRVEFISFKKMEPPVDEFIATKLGYL